ncbi:unnamed protein product [Brassica oleracea var. botrytis]|uniref:Uncharacterized protein n=2 Tax=Brassica TaxID=3705 RepID=A0A3P6B593_BRAOL|nr:unnamed protein product [Brassica napus]CDY70514.1 BnaCnng68690D [Brassica napus]VDC95593.1 unnamed protein product [Brassica oleracea]
MYYLDCTSGELCSLYLSHHNDHLTIQSKCVLAIILIKFLVGCALWFRF